MSYLVYCIFGSEQCKQTQRVLGMGSQPISVVSHDGLSAAVSRVLPADVTPDVSRLLAYGNVVEAFHEDLTVIPLRYGCLFDKEHQIVRVLSERAEQWKTLLKELDGCVEMGIRSLPENEEGGVDDEEIRRSYGKPEVARACNSGRAYLSAIKAHYARQERIAREDIAGLQRCREALGGVSVKSKMDEPLCAWLPRVRVPIPSLYFLIRRSDVESFRQAFREISSREPTGLLLSGPWPPYNFVEITRAGEAFSPAVQKLTE